MDAVNIVVLPALAFLVLAACAVMGWLIFRTKPPTKAPPEPGRKASAARSKRPVL